ncbi:hypothetical protein KIH74_04170 [Kineosporia sp. J2-2]|uniref:Uncharacterized protein n=1 Tax=Kineosporia corallincola TaxID=2835133 RepID=A0ABS5TCF9_9ACTN|nr:hypothetical protein [Kineosporia corallincola]MBT0768104.1 hypothetical protein [Kineosporia corallincola]
MIDVDVLSTAAGLKEFDAATVAAYCQTDEARVMLVLDEHGDLFAKRNPRHQAQPASPRYRVLHPDALARRITTVSGPPSDAPPFAPSPWFEQAVTARPAAPQPMDGQHSTDEQEPPPADPEAPEIQPPPRPAPDRRAAERRTPESLTPAPQAPEQPSSRDQRSRPRPPRSTPRPRRPGRGDQRREPSGSRSATSSFTSGGYTSGGYVTGGYTSAARNAADRKTAPDAPPRSPADQGTTPTAAPTPRPAGRNTASRRAISPPMTDREPTSPAEPPPSPSPRNNLSGRQSRGISAPAAEPVGNTAPFPAPPTPPPTSRKPTASPNPAASPNQAMSPNPVAPPDQPPPAPRPAVVMPRPTGRVIPAPGSRRDRAARTHDFQPPPAPRPMLHQLDMPPVHADPGPGPEDLDRLEVIHTRAPRTEADPRVTHAENSLMACAREPDPQTRHALASAAMSTLSECVPSLPRDGELHTAALPARLRFALTLATLTLIESTGQPIARKLLISAYDDATALAQEFLPSRQADLISRFRTLASGRPGDYQQA